MKRIVRTIDEQKRIAKKARVATIKELLLIIWEVIRAIGIVAIFFFLVVKLPIWIGEALGYGEIEIASMYAKIFCVIFVIAVLWFVVSSIYERNYRRIANREAEEQKEDSSELNLHNSKNCMYCGKQLVKRVDVYLLKGSINVQLAEKTGFTYEDAQVVKECLRTIFENDASSARPEGSMEVLKLYWFEHNSKSGQYSSAKVHRSVKVAQKDPDILPVSADDYEITLEELPGLTPEIIDGL